MNMEFKFYRRPTDEAAVNQIIDITKSLTGKWFTENVPSDTEKDIHFHDVLCISVEEKVVSFIIFTCLDGSINILLMGTLLDYQGLGYGSMLMKHFCDNIKKMGFDRIVAFTVPPKAKPSYSSTVNFYIKNGFVLKKEYTEMWENGAIELVKQL